MSELGPERIRFREGCPPPFCYVTQKNKREIYTRNILLWELKENGDWLDDVTCVEMNIVADSSQLIHPF
jgi:hypothetical protein